MRIPVMVVAAVFAFGGIFVSAPCHARPSHTGHSCGGEDGKKKKKKSETASPQCGGEDGKKKKKKNETLAP